MSILKKTGRICIGLLAIFAIFYGISLYMVTHTNSRLQYDKDGTVASFMIDSSDRTEINGIRFTIDTSSRHCFLADSTLQRLKAEGYPVDETWTLMSSYDQTRRRRRLFIRKAIMPLDIAAPSDDPGTKEHGQIGNVEFLIKPDIQENIIGIDFIENFCMEFQYPSRTLILHNSVPENYESLLKVKGGYIRPSLPLDIYRKCFFIPISVHNRAPRLYCITTGADMADFGLVLPLSDTVYVHGKAVPYAKRPGTYIHRECWIDVGNRRKLANVCYVPDGVTHDEYGCNPFRLFTQDFVIDFKDKTLYVHPMSTHIPYDLQPE